MIEEWFVIPIAEGDIFRIWLTSHPGYKFQQINSDKELYANSIRTIYNANEGDVNCQLTTGHSDQRGKLLVMFTFKEGTLDEGILGLMRQNFTVSNSSCY